LGYLYGRKQFLVSDYANEAANSGGAKYLFYDKDRHIKDSTWSNEYVSLNPRRKFFGQLKLTFRVISGMKVSYNFFGDKQDFSSVG